jgi:hypothetical protein
MLVVVGDFDIVGVAAIPAKTDTVLVVDPNAMLAGAVTLEGFEAVAGRQAQVFEGGGGFELGEFAEGNLVDGGGKFRRAATLPERRGRFIGERGDHRVGNRLCTEAVMHVKQE